MATCKNGHIWNKGAVTMQPTYVASGVMTYTCTVCNSTITREIPQLIYTGDGYIGGVTPATAIALDANTLNIDANTPATLIAKLTPPDSSDAITWTISDESSVEIAPKGAYDSCLVQGIGSGAAVVTATATSGVSATCEVTVVGESGGVL